MSDTLRDYIEKEKKALKRGLVATPSREYLNGFQKSCGGSNTLLLTQLAINFGYKLALDNIEEQLS